MTATDKAVNEAIDALAEKAKRGIRASSSSGVAYGDRAVINKQAELLKRALAAPAAPQWRTAAEELHDPPKFPDLKVAPAAPEEKPTISGDLRKHLDVAYDAAGDIRTRYMLSSGVRRLAETAMHEIKEAMLLAYPGTVAAPEEEK